MKTEDVFALGLGLKAPWTILGQSMDTSKYPFELTLEIGAPRGVEYPCPHCGQMCKAHDFLEMTWRHMDFFQHHCYLKARVPRIDCPKHGIHRIKVPWARKGSGFTLCFEQIVMSLAREMPVNAIARHVCVTDKRIWRIIGHYVAQAMKQLDLSSVSGVGLDETASKRGHKYVTVFLDMERDVRPVIFAVPGKGKECLRAFANYLKAHGGNPNNITEVVCDMSPSFLAATEEVFPYAAQTVDWFHVVQLFTRSMDEVRRAEAHKVQLPKGTRWAILKGKESSRSSLQKEALLELEMAGYATAKAFRVKEMLRWVRQAQTKQAARWRSSNFLRMASELIGQEVLLKPVRIALQTFKEHLPRIIHRWESLLCTARLEGLNSLFQAARARARGYRNTMNFVTMIYLIGAPIMDLLSSAFPQ